MTHQPTDGVSRRDLLRGSLGMALAAGCFTPIGLRAALREAHAAGKPLLTESELNRHIPSPRNRQAYLASIEFAKRDLLGYLTANFHLTPEQIEEVRAIPKEDLMQLNFLLDRAKTANLRLSVQIMRGGVVNLSDPHAVSLRMGSHRVRSRSIPQAAEPQPIEKGDPGQVQKRKAQELKAEAEKLKDETNDAGKFSRVVAQPELGAPIM